MPVRLHVRLLALAVLATLCTGVVRVATASTAPHPRPPAMSATVATTTPVDDIHLLRRAIAEETSRSLRRVALRVARKEGSLRIPSRTATPRPRAAHVTAPVVPSCHDSNIRESVSWQEAWIIDHESGWSTTALNASSGAFGLGQLTSQVRYAMSSRTGIPANTTDACGQVGLMRAYIAERYGTAGNAVAFWQAHGWY